MASTLTLPTSDIEEALHAIRDTQKLYWESVGIVPDEGEFTALIDGNQDAIAVWLRYYLLNDMKALAIAKKHPYSLFKAEAELHLSWLRLAQEIVAADHFGVVVQQPQQRDPLFWLVAVAHDYFERKMKGSGFLTGQANPIGKGQRYQWAITFGNELLSSSPSDLRHGQVEMGPLMGIYKAAEVLHLLDQRFSRGDYLYDAVRSLKRFYRQLKTSELKPTFLDARGQLVYLDRGRDTRGFGAGTKKKTKR